MNWENHFPLAGLIRETKDMRGVYRKKGRESATKEHNYGFYPFFFSKSKAFTMLHPLNVMWFSWFCKRMR